jgi:hypothetical protein
MNRRFRLAQLLGLAAVALWFAATSGCAGTHHEHARHGAAQLSLNNDNKWATDEALRLGMDRIRDTLEPQLSSIYAGETDVKQYDALAEGIDAHVAYMVQNCKLDGQTDAMLHLVLADVLSGADALRGKDPQVARPEGARKIVHALENYDWYFDHPGWRAPKLSP